MKNYKMILTLAAFTTSTFLYSCTESSTSDLQDAQLCLNTAASDSSALSCVEKISSDTSPLAYSLRCSAIFISQGFGDAASFVDALDSINGGSSGCGGGCSSTVSALNALRFEAADVTTVDGRAANNAAAASAFTQCSQADAQIYTQIASLFKLGTLTSMLAYSTVSGTLTETDLENALNSGNLDAETVGQIVSVTYEATCQNTEDASESTQAYCSELAAAIAGGADNTAIGQCLIDKLADPNATCP